jgi:hypothetical protein
MQAKSLKTSAKVNRWLALPPFNSKAVKRFELSRHKKKVFIPLSIVKDR